MSEKEKEIMELLLKAHRKFVEIKQTHPSDMAVWVDGIHYCQGVIMQRIIRRDYPDEFYSI